MTADDPTLDPADPPRRRAPVATDPPPGVTPEVFREGFGEELLHTLDLRTWQAGRDLGEEYRRIEAEVRLAVEYETEYQRKVRREVLPALAAAPAAPKGAGHYACEPAEVARVQRGLLFNGGVEACDGTSHVYDTLPVTIHQIGVSLVSYKGDLGTWQTRLFRRDLRVAGPDPVAEVLDVLQRRSWRGGLHQPTARDLLSELAQRVIMSYAERAILLRRSKAPWRLGHGSPAPYELLTGGGSADLMIEAVKVMRDLIAGHQKFVFVASEPGDRALSTIGQGLRPLEYAVVAGLAERLEPFIDRLSFGRPTVDPTWDGRALTPAQWVCKFRDEVASQVVVGVYRATLLGPPQLFYAHQDHADVAARVALADSVLQEQRGFPLLITLADEVCRSVYGGNSLREMAEAALAAAGAPFRYTSERLTRGR
jgi:hypothetical protein